MNKIATYLSLACICFFTLSNAQDRLSKENKSVLQQLVKKILDSDEDSGESYLLSFNDNHDDAFLVYKIKNYFVIEINQYTFKTTDINSNDYKNEVARLKGENISYTQINEETGEIIRTIPSYKFIIPKYKIDSLESIIVSLLLKNSNQPRLVFINSGT